MQKVCHVTSVHSSDDNRIFNKECSSLAAAGYEVYLVAQGADRVQNGVKVIGVGDIPKSRFRRMFGFSGKVYRKALELDCELYHLHDPELLPYALKFRRKGKKVIFDSHEKYTDTLKKKTYLKGFIGKTVIKLYEAYENHVFRRIDAVIFPCLYKGEHPFRGKCKRVETVDNMPIIEELYDQYDPQVQKWERSACYIGVIAKSRGVENFIKANNKAGGYSYIGGYYRNEDFRKELESSEAYASVRYLGKLDRSQVLDTLQHCRVGMATLLNVGQYNKYDNLPTKAYEYMSLGLPVILSKSDYNSRIMEEYRFGICVDPADTEEIAQALEYLYTHEEEARQMGENGRDAVIRRFNWEHEKAKLVKLYQEVL